MPKKRFVLFNKSSFEIHVHMFKGTVVMSSDIDKMLALRNSMNQDAEEFGTWAVCELIPYDEENDTLKEVKG